jgi:hypothetical protein
LRTIVGTSCAVENSRTSRPGSAAIAGSGSASGGTDQPVALNSPAFSIRESETSGRTTIFVTMASDQLHQ